MKIMSCPSLVIIMFLNVIFLGCNSDGFKPNTPSASVTEKNIPTYNVENIEVVDFESLKPIFNHKDETLYLINFWATWCVPCIKEMPYFTEYIKSQTGKNFKAYFISLDFADRLENKVIPYLTKNPLPGEVIILDDPDANAWISKVDENWSGAIPATYVYQGDKSLFIEKSFHSTQELSNWINTLSAQ